jgi:peptidyl-prolyl cis-trans isomerase SurA
VTRRQALQDRQTIILREQSFVSDTPLTINGGASLTRRARNPRLPKHRMKKICAIAVAALFAGAAPPLRADAINGRLVNCIMAIVHDSVITWDEVDLLNKQTLESLQREYGNRPELLEQKNAQVMQDNLKKLVQQQLILHEFQTAGYNLPESIIDDEIQDVIHRDYGDRLHLIMSLQQEGVTFEQYRQRMRDRIIVTIMRQKNISSEVVISPHKVEAYYLAHRDQYKVEDEVKIRAIVFNKSVDTNAPAAEKLAADCATKLKEGTSFDDLIKEMTQQNSDINRKGGSWYERSGLLKELADAAFALKTGQNSGIIDTPNACWLLRVEDMRPAHAKSLGEMRDVIERNLQLEEEKKLEESWIERLRKKTFVRTF